MKPAAPIHRRESVSRRRRWIGSVLVVAVLCGAATTGALLVGSGGGRRRLRRAGATTPTPVLTARAPTTVAPTTSTTVDPGLLPQTNQLPSATDPQFLARVGDLWQAVLTGQPALAQPAFFPLNAYIQVKGISDPVHDYETRLVPYYDQDIEALHDQIAAGGASVALGSVTVPNTAVWVLPGIEYNKGSYWRVYGTRVNFTRDGRQGYFTIASMISWRGEWYVVHLSSIR